MTEWREFVLGDLCERVTVGHVGKMADRYVEDGVPFLRSQNIQPFRIAREGMRHIDDSFHADLSKSELSAGDVAIVRTGYPGTAAVIPQELDGSNCADLVIVTPSSDLNPYMLAGLLNSAWGRSTVSGHLVGAAQQHFNVGSAKALKVSLPSRAIQDRIASVLCVLNDLMENNGRRVTALEEMARTIYREWFVHLRFPGHEKANFVDSGLGSIPDGWSPGTLDDLVVERRNTVAPEEVAGDTPLVGLEHIPRRRLTLDAWGTAEGLGSRKKQFDAGDILFSKIRPYFHKVAVAPLAGVCSTDALVFEATGPQRGLAIMAMSSDEVVAYATQTANGTKMPRADWKVLREHPVAIPSPELGSRFTEQVDQIVTKAAYLLHSNRKLATIRDMLLPKLVTGQIDVSELDLDAVVQQAGT